MSQMMINGLNEVIDNLKSDETFKSKYAKVLMSLGKAAKSSAEVAATFVKLDRIQSNFTEDFTSNLSKLYPDDAPIPSELMDVDVELQSTFIREAAHKLSMLLFELIS